MQLCISFISQTEKCENRCTQVKNPGDGVAHIFAKTPRGSRLGFHCIFINKSFEICLGGPMFTFPPSPHHPTPVCISVRNAKPPVLIFHDGLRAFVHSVIPNVSRKQYLFCGNVFSISSILARFSKKLHICIVETLKRFDSFFSFQIS